MVDVNFALRYVHKGLSKDEYNKFVNLCFRHNIKDILDLSDIVLKVRDYHEVKEVSDIDSKYDMRNLINKEYYINESVKRIKKDENKVRVRR